MTITTTGINGNDDQLVLRTLGDDDLVTVNVDGTDLIDVLMTVEGGGGSDTLAVTGTPTDSVLLAVSHIMRDHPPDLVLSGVNRGANMGEDVSYSGTIAAAMEGTLLGVPSIALSQVFSDGKPTKWATAETHAPDVIRKLVQVSWPKNVMININFPDVVASAVKGARLCVQGRRKLGDQLVEKHDPRGRPYYWIGPMRDETQNRPDTDIAAVRGGAISVTPLFLDLTHQPTIDELKKVF